MAERYYSNADEGQRLQPGAAAEAGQVDEKFDRVSTGFQEVAVDTDRAIKLPAQQGVSQEFEATPFQRRRKVLGFDENGNLALTSGFVWGGNWQAEQDYFPNTAVVDPDSEDVLVVLKRHESTSISADLAAGNLSIGIRVGNLVEVRDARDEAVAARNVAVAAAALVDEQTSFPGFQAPGGQVLTVDYGGQGAVFRHALLPLAYEERGLLRTVAPDTGAAALVRGLGLFVYEAGSDEPDDDETCLHTDNGAWLLEAVHWDYIDAALKIDTLRGRLLQISVDLNAVNIGTKQQYLQEFSFADAYPGDALVVTPPGSFNGSAGRLSAYAYCETPGKVVVAIHNASEAVASITLPNNWIVTLIKRIA